MLLDGIWMLIDEILDEIRGEEITVMNPETYLKTNRVKCAWWWGKTTKFHPKWATWNHPAPLPVGNESIFAAAADYYFSSKLHKVAKKSYAQSLMIFIQELASLMYISNLRVLAFRV